GRADAARRARGRAALALPTRDLRARAGLARHTAPRRAPARPAHRRRLRGGDPRRGRRARSDRRARRRGGDGARRRGARPHPISLVLRPFARGALMKKRVYCALVLVGLLAAPGARAAEEGPPGDDHASRPFLRLATGARAGYVSSAGLDAFAGDDLFPA